WAGLSWAQLWRWSRNGLIQAVTLPTGRKRFPREEIERLLTPTSAMVWLLSAIQTGFVRWYWENVILTR
ncbi:hypothetical protein Q604_UNBC09168G0001, partial [human gut metagenome]